jgi:hypothetical protein
MPGWKINCLKSEGGINPIEQTELTPSSIDHQNPKGKSQVLIFC